MPRGFNTVTGLINAIDSNITVLSTQNEKWPNNIVYKLKEFKNEIAYQGILTEPNESNICYKDSSDNKYCHCNSSCIKCRDNKSDILPVILLEKNQMRSKRCKEYIFPSYSFNNIKIGKFKKE